MQPKHIMERNRDLRTHLVGTNVPRWERVASVVVGGGLAGIGLARRSLGGAVVAAIGAGLVVRGVTGHCGLYRMRAVRKGVQFRRAVTIQATPQEIYELWRDLRNLPRFMGHVARVELESDRVSRWVIEQGPKTLEWRAEIVEDNPGRRLRWRSLDGSDIEHEGTLDLVEAPGGRGTIVDVRMRYWPPGGLPVAGILFHPLRELPGLQLAEELARLRMLVETGELATGASNPGDLSLDEKVHTAMGV